MTYSEKVENGKKVYDYICGMGVIPEATEIMDFEYMGCDYTLTCFSFGEEGNLQKVYGVVRDDKYLGRELMSVDKVTKTALHLFTYDMFEVKRTYKLPLYEMGMR